MSALATEIGLSAARVGQLVKRAEVATLSRTACFFRVVAAGEHHRLRISMTGGTTYMRFPAFGPVGPCGLQGGGRRRRQRGQGPCMNIGIHPR